MTVKAPVPPEVTFADYVTCDDDVQTSAELTTEEIPNYAQKVDHNNDEEDGSDLEDPRVLNTEAVSSIVMLRTCLGRCPSIPDEVLQRTDNVETYYKFKRMIYIQDIGPL